ncbi:MAG: hypothetical protein MZV49_08505 [Rhodopseudomonas palustris]|nr:hypothetical protein [Rhodopseudomonas palustris]
MIGGPRFYERAGNPRRASPICDVVNAAGRRPRLRAHRQRAASAASATPPCKRCTTTAARTSAFRCIEAARAIIETDELKPKARGRRSRDLVDVVRALARAAASRCRIPSWPRSCSTRSGYTEMWQNDTLGRRRRAGWKT